MAAFKQKAKGASAIGIVPGSPHCGISDSGILRYKWAVKLTYGPDPLDESGFLLDNLSFTQYFDGLSAEGPIDYSCEVLAQRVCREMFKLACDRLVSTSVTISPFKGVEVNCSYSKTAGGAVVPCSASD